MLKLIILVIVFCYTSFASNVNEEFQVVAKNLEYKDNIIIATGDVVMFSPTYYITADKVIYNRNGNEATLVDNVMIIKDNVNLTLSNNSFVKFDVFSNSEIVFILYENNLWIESAQVSSKNNDVFLKDSFMSSCDCNDPDWSIRFTSGSHSDKYSWLQTFNNRVYVKNIPVFYMPYFAFYTNTKRHSGLLVPTIGYSKDEGFVYMQPIYYAPADNWDIEFVPQHRAKRGNGLYTYFRYADSPDSMLKIQTGYFKEEKQYQQRHNLKNQEHYGIGLSYERRNLFFNNSNTQDGLYVDLDFLRDIEYKNLSDQLDNDTSTSKLVESKINYFYADSNNYLGSYLRYYTDVSDSSKTSKETQQKTIQKLPVVHYHRFFSPILTKNLFYSLDSKVTNYHRTKGLKAVETNVSLPFFYGFSLFDDYLNVSLQEEIFMTHFNYDENNTGKDFDDGRYIQLRHTATVSTNLLKEYDTFLHTVNLGSTLYVPNNAKVTGDIYKISDDDVDLKNYPLTQTQKNLAFWLSHSFYDKDFAKLFLNHKIRQSILYDGDGNSKLGDLENEVIYYYGLGSISSRLFFNHKDNELVKSTTSLRLLYDDYFFNTRHYWTKKTLNSSYDNSESIEYEAGLKFWKHYKFSYKENYNILQKILNKKEYRLTIDKGCWYFHLSLKDEIIPTSTISNKPSRQDIIYFIIELRPIGGFEQEYKRKTND